MEYPLIRDWISNLVSDSLKYSKLARLHCKFQSHDYMGAWGLKSPLGNATRGLSPPEGCEKEHFWLSKSQKPKITVQH